MSLIFIPEETFTAGGSVSATAIKNEFDNVALTNDFQTAEIANLKSDLSTIYNKDINGLNAVNVYTNNITSTGSVLNIGTTGANTIYIGSNDNNTSVYLSKNLFLQGDITNIQTTNLEVVDKTIQINKNGATGSSDNAGIYIQDGAADAGYIKINSSRDKVVVKAPLGNEIEIGAVNLTPTFNVVNTNIINAATGAFTSISASSGITGSNIYGDRIQGNTGVINKIQSDNVETNTLTCGTGSVNSLSVSQGITGNSGNFVSLTAKNGTYDVINSATGAFTSISATSGITGSNIYGDRIQGNTGIFNSLTATNLNISNPITLDVINAGTGNFTSLSTSGLTGASIYGSKVEGNTGNFSSVSANNITSQVINSATGIISKLSVSSGLTGASIYGSKVEGNTGNFLYLKGGITETDGLVANGATIYQLNNDTINSGTGNFNNLSVSVGATGKYFYGDKIEGNTGAFNSISASNVSTNTLTSNSCLIQVMNAPTGVIDRLSVPVSATGKYFYGDKVEGNTGSFTYLSSSTGVISNLSVDNLNVVNPLNLSSATFTNINTSGITGNQGYFNRIEGNTGVINKIQSDNINTNTLVSNSCLIGEINGTTGFINNLVFSVGATGKKLYAEDIRGNTGVFVDFKATNATIDNLNVVNPLNINNVVAGTASITSLSYSSSTGNVATIATINNQILNGATGIFVDVAYTSSTGNVATIRTINNEVFNGSTGVFNSISYSSATGNVATINTINNQILNGSTGNFVDVAYTSSTGNVATINTINNQILNGSTGVFTTLNYTSATGNSININNLTASTGVISNLSYTSGTGNTLNINRIQGATGVFTSGITGNQGHFQNLFASTGNFTNLSVQGVPITPQGFSASKSVVLLNNVLGDGSTNRVSTAWSAYYDYKGGDIFLTASVNIAENTSTPPPGATLYLVLDSTGYIGDISGIPINKRLARVTKYMDSPLDNQNYGLIVDDFTAEDGSRVPVGGHWLSIYVPSTLTAFGDSTWASMIIQETNATGAINCSSVVANSLQGTTGYFNNITAISPATSINFGTTNCNINTINGIKPSGGVYSASNGIALTNQQNTNIIPLLTNFSGNTVVPTNGFQVNDSFILHFGGTIANGNSNQIPPRIGLYSNYGLAGEALLAEIVFGANIGNIGTAPFNGYIVFQIKALGTAGLAIILANGLFTYTAAGTNTIAGTNIFSLNSTTFNTTIQNTLALVHNPNSFVSSANITTTYQQVVLTKAF